MRFFKKKEEPEKKSWTRTYQIYCSTGLRDETYEVSSAQAALDEWCKKSIVNGCKWIVIKVVRTNEAWKIMRPPVSKDTGRVMWSIPDEPTQKAKSPRD